MNDYPTDVEPARSNPPGTSASSEMAQPDSDRLPDDELVSLWEDESSNGSSYILKRNLARALDAAGMTDVETVDVVLDVDEPEQPAIVLLPIESDAEANHAINPRSVRFETENAAEARIPPRFLGGRGTRDDVPEDLGLSLEHYDNDNKLLFEPVIGDGVLLLLPTRFESGREYVSPTERDFEYYDRTARTSGTLPETDVQPDGPPIDPRTIHETAQTNSVPAEDVEAALEAIDEVVDDLEWQVPVQYQPLNDDDRVVHVVPGEVWAEIGDAVREDLEVARVDEVLEAAELAHLSAARDVVEETGASGYRHFEREFSAVLESE